MKQLLGTLCNIIAGAGMAGLFVAGFLAYFIRRIDPILHHRFDGLGRQLYDTPSLVHFILRNDSLWSGWGWFFADIVIFFGGMGLFYALFNFGTSLRESQASRK